MMNVIESNAKYLVGSVVTIALLEVLGIVFSCMLLKKIRQSTGYEPQFNNYWSYLLQMPTDSETNKKYHSMFIHGNVSYCTRQFQ